MKRVMMETSSFRRSLRRGTKVVVLIADNHASKLAMKMARALCRPRDELVLVTVVLSEDSLHYGNDLLAPFLQAEQPQQQQQQQQQPPSSTSTASGPAFVTPVVLVKGDGRLGDVIDAYATSAGADLLVVGSQNLCVDAGSFALRLVKLVRCCPVLVVKANSRGPYVRSDSSALGLKVMVDCRSNSRHMLGWLMDQMAADKDSLFLAVTRAHDQGTGRVKETSSRMLTNFSVQASTNDFYTAQRVFKDSGCKALPQAVEADAIDILAIQAPDCKQLPDALLDLLQTARTSLLIYHHKAEDEAASLAAAAAGVDEWAAMPMPGGRRAPGLPRVTV